MVRPEGNLASEWIMNTHGRNGSPASRIGRTVQVFEAKRCVPHCSGFPLAHSGRPQAHSHRLRDAQKTKTKLILNRLQNAETVHSFLSRL
jgi:hypothetical protein